MLLLYFLDTYISLVKYLQRVPLDVSITWHYLHQDVVKTLFRNIKYEIKLEVKVTISRHMKKSIGDLVVAKE